MTFGFAAPRGINTTDRKTFAVFAKYWESGQVKTRLARVIGDAAAAEIYRQFLQLLLERLADWSGQKVLGFSPADRAAEFAALAADWQRIPQADGDLGTRMRKFFEHLFSSSTETFSDELPPNAPVPDQPTANHLVILIGSDTPLLPRQRIERAFTELASHDVVLGPSEDGGYYLVGARNRTPEIFDDIDWSTSRVFEQTVQRLNHRGYSYALLDPYRDVDDLDDLRWLTRQLAAPPFAERTEYQRLGELCRIATQQAQAHPKASSQNIPSTRKRTTT